VPKDYWIFLEFLKGYWTASGKYSNTRRQPIGKKAEFPKGYQQKRGNFHSFSLKRCISVYIHKNLKHIGQF
jgi:hypothetical protein